MKKESFKAFEKVIKSMSKEKLNDIIEEVSNMDTGGEPTIDEYFNQCPPIIDKVE